MDTELPDTGWLPRYDESSVVTPNGTIVLTGGFTNWADGFGYQNDVWSLSTAGSSDQTPSHTYTIPGRASVTLQASNAYGYNSTQKTGYIIATGSRRSPVSPQPRPPARPRWWSSSTTPRPVPRPAGTGVSVTGSGSIPPTQLPVTLRMSTGTADHLQPTCW